MGPILRRCRTAQRDWKYNSRPTSCSLIESGVARSHDLIGFVLSTLAAICDHEAVTTSQGRPLREQIRHAIDPTGEQLPLIDVINSLPEMPGWMRFLTSTVGRQFQEAKQLGRESQRLVSSMEEALECLVPRGWAPFNMPTATVDQAVVLVRAGQAEQADELLAAEWDGWRIGRICARVSTMGAGHRQRDYEELFHQRARLLKLAREHHLQGRFDASIPIVHAQMEGIVMDVGDGKKFFTKGHRKADLVDPAKLIGIEACLSTLQVVYGEDVPQTQAKGSLSRHGIAHGRELAYDTEVNSAKNWSVLDALVEWAQPLADGVASQRRMEQQHANAGSQERDLEGRQIDDREFPETRDCLWRLHTASMGWWDRHQRFRGDLVGGVFSPSDFVKKGLPHDHGIHSAVTDDGQLVWHWRRTVSGWVLGICTGRNGDKFCEWQYAAADDPPGSPLEFPEEWGTLFQTLPDWT